MAGSSPRWRAFVRSKRSPSSFEVRGWRYAVRAPPPEKIHAAPAELAGARAGEEKADSPLLDQKMHLVEQRRNALNFIDDDELLARADFLGNSSGILAESQKRGRIEKIVDAGSLQPLADEEALARLARTEKEIGFLPDKREEVQIPRDGNGRFVVFLCRHHRHLS